MRGPFPNLSAHPAGRRATTLGAILVCAIVLAACGSSDAGRPTSTSDSTPTSTVERDPRLHWPDLEPGERYGIDVSNHQGAIDWEAVAADDIEFAYLKATEGGDHVDRRFAENWDAARAAGLERGAYHYFTFCRPGAEQAANFLTVVPADPGAMPPALDLELAGNCAARPTQEEMAAEVDAYLSAVEAGTGQSAVLYVGKDFAEAYPGIPAGDRLRWVQHVHRRPAVDDWWLWQATVVARVDGIEGNVDLDVQTAS